MASALFEPIQWRSLVLPNRIMVSPMCQYIAEDGSANDWHLMHLGQLSMGAAGLLMVEAVASADYPVAQAAFLLIAVLTVLGTFAADLLYGILDQRIVYT